MTQMSDDEIYRLAAKRVKDKRGFWVHFSVYCVVNIFLVILWWTTTGGTGYPWFIWCLFGWGIGIVFNALAVFVWSKPEYDRAAIEKEAAKIRGGK